jgi:hypothetical protein
LAFGFSVSAMACNSPKASAHFAGKPDPGGRMIVVVDDTRIPLLLQGGGAVDEFGLDNRLGAQGSSGGEWATIWRSQDGVASGKQPLGIGHPCHGARIRHGRRRGGDGCGCVFLDATQ